MSKNKEVMKLLSDICESNSNEVFIDKIDSTIYKLLPDYSYGNIAFPRFCSYVLQKIDTPTEIFVLNRGLAAHHFDSSGAREEAEEVLSIAQCKEPEDTDQLPNVVRNLKREFDITNLYVGGHSRGALVVEYNANEDCFNPDDYDDLSLVSVDSPGANNFELKNNCLTEYKSGLPSFVNTWAPPLTENPILIDNYKDTLLNSNYIEASFSIHTMQKIYNNFDKQHKIESWMTPIEAYENFIELGGSRDALSDFLVRAGLFLQNLPHYPDVLLRQVLRVIRLDGQQNHKDTIDFHEWYDSLPPLEWSLSDIEFCI